MSSEQEIQATEEVEIASGEAAEEQNDQAAETPKYQKGDLRYSSYLTYPELNQEIEFNKQLNVVAAQICESNIFEAEAKTKKIDYKTRKLAVITSTPTRRRIKIAAPHRKKVRVAYWYLHKWTTSRKVWKWRGLKSSFYTVYDHHQEMRRAEDSVGKNNLANYRQNTYRFSDFSGETREGDDVYVYYNEWIDIGSERASVNSKKPDNKHYIDFSEEQRTGYGIYVEYTEFVENTIQANR